MRMLDILGAGGVVAARPRLFLLSGRRRSGSTASCSSRAINIRSNSALRTLTAGGLFGAGPGAGTRKFALPEPHTDYIFSVIGEEFGIIACLAIAILYLAIVARVLSACSTRTTSSSSSPPPASSPSSGCRR